MTIAVSVEKRCQILRLVPLRVTGLGNEMYGDSAPHFDRLHPGNDMVVQAPDEAHSAFQLLEISDNVDLLSAIAYNLGCK